MLLAVGMDPAVDLAVLPVLEAALQLMQSTALISRVMPLYMLTRAPPAARAGPASVPAIGLQGAQLLGLARTARLESPQPLCCLALDAPGTGAAEVRHFLLLCCSQMHPDCSLIHSGCCPMHPGCSPIHTGCGPMHPGCGPMHPDCGPVHPGCGPMCPGCGSMHPGCSPMHHGFNPMYHRCAAFRCSAVR